MPLHEIITRLADLRRQIEADQDRLTCRQTDLLFDVCQALDMDDAQAAAVVGVTADDLAVNQRNAWVV